MSLYLEHKSHLIRIKLSCSSITKSVLFWPQISEEEEVDKMMEQKMKEEEERKRTKEIEERMSLEETKEQVSATRLSLWLPVVLKDS